MIHLLDLKHPIFYKNMTVLPLGLLECRIQCGIKVYIWWYVPTTLNYLGNLKMWVIIHNIYTFIIYVNKICYYRYTSTYFYCMCIMYSIFVVVWRVGDRWSFPQTIIIHGKMDKSTKKKLYYYIYIQYYHIRQICMYVTEPTLKQNVKMISICNYLY